MSANNYLHIRKFKDDYEVSSVDADGCGGYIIGYSKTFKGARKLAYDYEKNNEVEYGIKIDEDCYEK